MPRATPEDSRDPAVLGPERKTSGDWAVVIAGLEPSWLWRSMLAVAGGVALPQPRREGADPGREACSRTRPWRSRGVAGGATRAATAG